MAMARRLPSLRIHADGKAPVLERKRTAFLRRDLMAWAKACSRSSDYEYSRPPSLPYLDLRKEGRATAAADLHDCTPAYLNVTSCIYSIMFFACYTVHVPTLIPANT